MATQGQRRAEAKALIRRMRQAYRATDTAGEAVERELDRILKRKTLIQAEQLGTLIAKTDEFYRRIKVYLDVLELLTVFIRDIPV